MELNLTKVHKITYNIASAYINNNEPHLVPKNHDTFIGFLLFFLSIVDRNIFNARAFYEIISRRNALYQLIDTTLADNFCMFLFFSFFFFLTQFNNFLPYSLNKQKCPTRK